MAADDLDRDQIASMLEEGYASILRGEASDADEVWARLDRRKAAWLKANPTQNRDGDGAD